MVACGVERFFDIAKGLPLHRGGAGEELLGLGCPPRKQIQRTSSRLHISLSLGVPLQEIEAESIPHRVI